MTIKSTASASQAHPAEGSRRGPGCRRRGEDERGTAYIGTLIGSAIFLLFLLFAAQVLVHLFATSTVTAAAYDAAQAVATDPNHQPGEILLAEAQARRKLGGLGRRTNFDWKEVDGQQVVLELKVRSPGFLPLASSLLQIQRTVVVRTERFR